MTSKNELRQVLSSEKATASWYLKNWREADATRVVIEKERYAFQKENEHLSQALEHSGEHVNTLAKFLDDILVIEPQLKHLITGGVWDFQRIHRAAEVLRGDDALESVGYTTSTAFPENVTPIRPTDPRNGQGAA